MKTALRALAKAPSFTCIAVVTLALGIGMNTAMFSLLNGFLLRPLQYPGAEELFRLDLHTAQQPYDDHAPLNVADIAAATEDIAELASFRYWGFTISGADQPPEVVTGLRISPNLPHVLGLTPTRGRSFLPEEDAPGKNNVVILSHGLWMSRFHGDDDIVGKAIRIDGVPTEVVGVMPPDPDEVRVFGSVKIFRPLAMQESERNRTDRSLGVIGRYRAGSSPEQAAARFETVGRQLAADHPTENAGTSLGIRSLQASTLSGTGLNMTLVLVGLSGFVLLIACANLANLLLARAISRAREFSIRGALGATRLQLIRPLAAECLLLAGAGGVAALLVSGWTTDWLGRSFSAASNPVDFSADARVFAFAVGATTLTAFLFGVAPAWWAARVPVNDSLKSGGRGSTGSRAQDRYRQTLIVAQFAFALVLLYGAGTFVRGLQRFIGADLGWSPDRVVSGMVNLASPTRFGSAEPILAFHAQLRERLLALPGVEQASVSYDIPLFHPPSRRNFVIAGRETPPPGQEIAAYTNGVSSSFLDTMGLRLLRGRFIDDSDQLASPPVVVINETMARTLFGDVVDAIGQRMAVAGGTEPAWAEIVGVVADVRTLNMRPSPVRFQVYKPFTQEAWQFVAVSIRVAHADKAAALLAPFREAVAASDPDMPVLRLMSVPDRIESNFGIWSTINSLLIIFATLGLLLAAVGVFGVISRIVAQRTSEIGVRMALGAQVRDIMHLMLGRGIRMALTGAALGGLGAFLLFRAIGNALPAFGRGDPATLAVAGLVLLAVALIACYLPARRATKVDPTVALRSD